MYQIEGRATNEFKKWLRKAAGDELKDVEALLDAIEGSPFRLDENLYLLDWPNEDLKHLHIYVRVIRARIRRSRFSVIYTVLDDQKLVRIREMKKGSWIHTKLAPKLDGG